MNLPAEYRPYTTIRLCGNTLKEVGFIFKIGDQAPLLIGKGEDDKHPQIWLYARVGSSSAWLPLVQKNIVASSHLSNPIMVIEDARKPITIVMAGPVVLLYAALINPDAVDVETIDLRPTGLNIFGTAASGLNFGGNLFMSNVMHSVGTAFGSPQ
jgi:hypothetical protein